MAAGSGGGGGSASLYSYIGSFVTFTSKCEIRYEGVLYHIDDPTIGVANVRSFGTEGRKRDGLQIPAREEIYDYVLFRRSDIKDLWVESPPPAQVYEDPAIIRALYPSSSRRMSVDGVEVPSVQEHGLAMLNSPTLPFDVSPTRTMSDQLPKGGVLRDSYTPAANESPLQIESDMRWQAPADYCSRISDFFSAKSVTALEDAVENQLRLDSTPDAKLKRKRSAVSDRNAADNATPDEIDVESRKKDEYWQSERCLYNKRIHDFLARVGPVLGDRTFSKWKGSIVDSVIGVILSQNCADTISSVAYMTLAARFPLRSYDDSTEPNAGKAVRSTERKNVLDQEQERNADIPVGTGKMPSIGTKVTPKHDWDKVRKEACPSGVIKERSPDVMDSVDWESVRSCDVQVIADAIKDRGMQNLLADRIKDFLNTMVIFRGGIDLEWLRDVKPKTVQDFFCDIKGLGLKSAECLRLLTLHQVAFPVDVNVNRILTRLGWIPLLPLPKGLEFHKLQKYPQTNSLQGHVWPRLCKLEHEKLYEFHYHLITFGKVFCKKKEPNCYSCPMKEGCKHFESASASEDLDPESDIGTSSVPKAKPRKKQCILYMSFQMAMNFHKRPQSIWKCRVW